MSFTTSAGRLTVNAPQVIHETIDGEVIAINLGTGTYYSLRGSAAEAWELIASAGGITRATLVEALASRYAADDGEISAALEPFVSQLEGEELVANVDGGDEAASPIGDSATHAEPSGPFTPPALEKFTDMQDLVLLDPVHEADDLGWPRRAGSAGEQAA
jgi:hypothetical protein